MFADPKTYYHLLFLSIYALIFGLIIYFSQPWGWVIGIVAILSLFILSEKIKRIVEDSFKIIHSETPLYMLYDGKCPVCSREVCFLKKKKSSINYVDITTENLEPFSVTQEEAMKQMSVVVNGRVLKGVDAFHEIYLRRGLIFLGILITLPGFKSFFRFFYYLFAKFRHKFQRTTT